MSVRFIDMALKVGDKTELEIIDNGTDGEGIAKYEGMAVFVPFVLPGETVRAEITLLKKNFARAKVIKLLKSSPLRQEPPCPLFRKCGGCDYQHIKYEAQLEIKRAEVKNCLKKYAGLDVEVGEVVPSKEVLRYRNKVQLPIALFGGKIRAGFFKEKSHDFIPIEDCLLQGEWAKSFIAAFVEYANESKLTAYDERTQKGLLRHLVLRKIGDSVNAVVVINGKSLPNRDNLIQKFKALSIPFNLFYSINTKNTNVILGETPVCFYGSELAQTEILGVKTNVSPASFMQVNDSVRDLLYQYAADAIKEKGCDIVFDVFSGVGILSNILAKVADKVYGIEIVKDAVDNANEMARSNGNLDKITNICGDAAVVLPKLVSEIFQSRNGVLNTKPAANLENNCDINLKDKSDNGCDTIIAAKNKLNDNGANSTVDIKTVSDETNKHNDIKSDKKFNNVEEKNEYNKASSKDSLNSFDTNSNLNTLSLDKPKSDSNLNALNKPYSDDFIYQSASSGIYKKEKSLYNQYATNCAVVLDPPRKGCDESVLNAILTAKPQTVVYISCNPATLARDLKILSTEYKIDSVTPFDMFPQCAHVECVTLMSRA